MKNKSNVTHAHRDVVGPTRFETLYLLNLKRELEAFLKGKNFATIHDIELAVYGNQYTTKLTVTK